MKAPAIAALIAKIGTDVEPTDAETIAAIEEGFDIALGFFADVRRIADAASNLGECVDDNCQPAFVVKALVEPAAAPSADD